MKSLPMCGLWVFESTFDLDSYESFQHQHQNPSIHPIDPIRQSMKKNARSHTNKYEPYFHRLVDGARDVVVVLSDIKTPDATRMRCFQHRCISLPEINVDAFIHSVSRSFLYRFYLPLYVYMCKTALPTEEVSESEQKMSRVSHSVVDDVLLELMNEQLRACSLAPNLDRLSWFTTIRSSTMCII